MTFDNIVPQSAGSLSVAVVALVMTVLQILFFFRKPQFKWFGWGAAGSFSGMVYAVGIFLEYNTIGPVNRFGGLLEFTAILGLVHCLYGFTLAYFGIKAKGYHLPAGIFHGLLFIFLWSSDYIVADRFVARNFTGLAKPFMEADLGPFGALFELYAVLSSVGAILLWIKHKSPHPGHKAPYLAGILFWIALGVHDGLASLGVPSFQYMMEYGFLGFSIAELWVVFDSFVEISAEDKYRVITESANDCILVIQDEKAVFSNRACAALIGRPVMDSAAEDFLKGVVPEDKERLIRQGNRALQSGDPIDSLTIRLKSADGEERIAEVRMSVIRYRNQPAVLAIVRNITERIRKEEALKESEEKILRLRKMESLGLLAGGVAHDLNNVLSGIVGYPELILRSLPADSQLRRPIETMQESGQKAVAIVQDLLTVARGVAIPKEALNLNDVIRGYLNSPEYRMLFHYHPTVVIKEDLAPGLSNIKGSPLHMGKVVMNLVSNAFEAVEGHGQVVVSTRNRRVDRQLKGYDDVCTGDYAVLTVEDNGPGISADDLKRIFEPFFTKKVMGRSGTGLGLTLVWNVIQDHDGYIDVKSSQGGTKFKLYFPVIKDSVPEKKSFAPIEDLFGRGETILIIDDVKTQREILCHMLETLNYNTKAVSGGEEAVDFLKECRVDLLLLDMIMDPGINGRETYERIKKIRPEQKAIIISGFTETDQVKETLKLGAGRYLKKPLTLEELGWAVKEELRK
jgi:PAS domain S-box-containing protein